MRNRMHRDKELLTTVLKAGTMAEEYQSPHLRAGNIVNT